MASDSDDDLLLWLKDQLRQGQKALEEQNAALLRDVATRLQRTSVIEVPAAPPPPPTIANPFTCKQTPLRSEIFVETTEELGHMPEESTPGSEIVVETNLQEQTETNESLQAEFANPVASISSLKSERSSKKYTSTHLRNLAGTFREDDETRLQAFVHSVVFELASGALILVCLVVMAIEMQYKGFDLGRNIEYQGYTRSAHEEWIDLDLFFEVLNLIFNLLFIIELTLRLAADQISAFKSPWIWFDAALIAFGAMELVGLNSSLNPRQLRVVRLVRLLRALKIVRVIRAFDSLHLLIKSIHASVGALVWSFVLLIFVQVACGMVLSQLLSTYISEGPSDEIQSRRLVFERFGTFTKAMLTMYEITFANWYPSCHLLATAVSESYAIFFILYRCCFCFAVLKVITAVFIAETNRVVAADDQIMITKKQQDAEVLFGKLRTLFNELDTNGDGHMSHEEFMQLMKDKLLKTWLATLDINVTELDHLFGLIDQDDSGSISIEEFVGELPRLKGPASSADIKMLLKMLRQMQMKLDRP